MGQMAGRDVWPAIAGFLITGVGLPLLGVIALGKQPLQRTDGDEPAYRQAVRCLFLLCALPDDRPLLQFRDAPPFRLPLALTRCYLRALEVPSHWRYFHSSFGIVLYFSLRPGEILTWVGKVLNPLF